MKASIPWSLGVIGFAATIVACSGLTDSGEPPGQSLAFQLLPDEPAVNQFRRLADVDSSFAGVWYDADRDEVVVNIAGNPKLDVRSYAREIVDTRVKGLRGKAYRTQNVARGLAELQSFARLAEDGIGSLGIQSVGVQNRFNRIRVGVTSKSSLDLAKSWLRDIGIPEDALVVESEEPIATMVLLTDKRRPQIKNGFRVSNKEDQKCSHGADAVVQQGGSAYYGFVIAGHCSETIENAGELIYQNNKSVGNIVGAEALDPVGFTGGACPASYRCRYSDASFVVYTSSSHWANHQITESTVIGTGTSAGNLTVGIYRPAPGTSDIIEGLTVRKTGQTTGTTEGMITSTCTASSHPDSPSLRILCSAVVSARAGQGDSGGPVYWIDDSTTYHVGILWGGIGLQQFYFSPWSSISSDMPTVWY